MNIYVWLLDLPLDTTSKPNARLSWIGVIKTHRRSPCYLGMP